MPLVHPLIMVRHGETDWNVEARLQGQQDIPLNGRGRQQAAAVGRALLAAVPDLSDFTFVASPLDRARETMELMRGAMHVDPAAYATDPRLKELTFGDWEGKTWGEVRHSDPDGAAAREADKWACVPPSGESYGMLAERVSSWLAERDGPTLAVSHGGVSRVLLHLICDLPQRDCPMRVIAQGRALIFEGTRYRWV